MTQASGSALDEKYTARRGRVFMTGIQALVRVAFDQHRADELAGLNTATFVSGYQGSPLGTYDIELSRRRALLAEHNVVFQPGLNEEIAATSVMGTQLVAAAGRPRYDGVVGIWYGKAPGVDRASDALRHGNLIGTTRRGGAIAVAGDDPTAKSSSLPCTSEGAFFDLGIPFLFPGDVQEVLDFGLHAVALSRSSGLWAGLKIVTNVADGSATVDVGDERAGPELVDLIEVGRITEHRPSSLLIGANLQDLERTLRYARIEAAQRYIAHNGLNRIAQRGSRDEVGIVAPGKSYFDLREALHSLGLDDRGLAAAGIRLLKVGAPFPLDCTIVREFADGLREVIVLEEKRAYVELFVKDALYGSAGSPVVVGKRDEHGAPLVPSNGELSADLIARTLASRLSGLDPGALPLVRERLPALSGRPGAEKLPVIRTPYFCSGCPHNTSTKVPDGSVVGAGIGCSGLVMLMNPKQVGAVTGTTQMGGEGAQWIGIAPFTEVPHSFQNIGDGTFMHSGSLALRAAVASGVNLTYKLLFNSAVAMTGGQQAVGSMTTPQLVQLLLTEGVRRVIITTDDVDRYRGAGLPKGVDVFSRDRLLEAEAILARTQGVTVLLHDQECAAEKRRKRKRGTLSDPSTRVFINERVCEGCGDCGEKSNCLSVVPVETEFGRKTQIDQTSCNKDYSCLRGDCPSFLEVIPGEAKTSRRMVPPLEAQVLPEPAQMSNADEFSIRITGIGGTGVVTIAQIVATAARSDGWFVRGLDQTGMAQKGGPVVSDLRLLSSDNPRTNKLGAADCDLYLGCDLLVAAEPANLLTSDPARTAAFISPAAIPTGAMVVDATVEFPPVDELVKRVKQQTRADGTHVIDVRAVTEALFGSNQTSNMMLVGAAYQAGALPVSAESIERAIVANGASVDANVQAFRRGRQAIADPAGLVAATEAHGRTMMVAAPPSPLAGSLSALVRADPASPLGRLVEQRVAELISYQNARYARRYVEQIERIRAVEAERVPDVEQELATVVAFNLFKLMAYKDEAEVARLSLDPRLKREIEAEFGPGASYSWKLHPPVFRALGLQRKITLGPWFAPFFRLLYASRHLRGTRFNPFGYGEIRRLERDLVTEYLQVLDDIARLLSPANHAAAVTIASLPGTVRGYEQVKLRSIKAYRTRLAELRPQLTATEEAHTWIAR